MNRCMRSAYGARMSSLGEHLSNGFLIRVRHLNIHSSEDEQFSRHG